MNQERGIPGPTKDRDEICNLLCMICTCNVREMYRYFILGISEIYGVLRSIE